MIIPDMDPGIFYKADGSWLERGADERMVKAGLGLIIDNHGKEFDADGFSVWHYWAESPDPEKTFLNIFENIKNPNHLSNGNHHPLFFITLRDKDLALSKWLSKIKTDKFGKTVFGDSFWHAIAWSGTGSCMDILKNKLDISSIDDLDGDHLCAAVIAAHRSGGPGVMRWIEAGADPNVADHHKRTVLHHVAIYANDDLYERMLDAGADDTLKNDKGQTPADVFKQSKIKDKREIGSLKQHWGMRAFIKNDF